MSEQQQTVRDAMNGDAPTVNGDASVSEAARLMREADVSIVAVVDDDEQLIGVITDRDIAILVASGADASTITVAERMNAQPVSVDEDQRLDQALQQMMDEGVRRAPVTDDAGHVSGTLSQQDGAGGGEARQQA
jgi:CBS domain-containing protein